jgi:hypothetical protein
MAGRHAQQPGRLDRRRTVLVAVGAGLALLLAGALTWGMTSSPAPTPAAARSEPSPGTPAAPNAAEPGAEGNTPPAALVSCARAEESGTAVVETAVASRNHWGDHVKAQLDYDAGTITAKQMVDIFAATRQAGPADLASYDTARAQFQPQADACTGLDAAGMAERWRPVAAECTTRAGQLATAVQASDAVVGDWRAHVAMMQNKPHTDRDEYGKMWRDMIVAAPPHLQGYTAARDALNQLPPCQVASS